MTKYFRNPFVLTLGSGLIAGYTIIHGIFMLAWVSFIPLFIALHQKTLKQSMVLGMAFGFASVLNCLWMVTLTSSFTGSGLFMGLMAMLICTVVAVLFRAFMMFGLFFINSINSNSLFFKASAVAFAWVLMEMVWTIPLSGMPWINYHTGDTLLGNFYAIQPAAYFGVHVLTFAVIFVNYLFASLVLQKKWKKLFLPVLFIFFYLGAGWVSVQWFDEHLSPSGKSFTVALLTDNVPPETKWNDRTGNMIVENIFELNREAVRLRPNIILWSESAVPWTYRPDDDLLKEVHKITDTAQITQLVGMNTDYSGKQVYNSLYCILPDDSIAGRYDKSTLLDFIEKRVGGILVPFFSDNGFYVKEGQNPVPLKTPYGKAGVMICNESFLSSTAVNMARKGAEFLVNPSNDGWFRETAIVEMHFYNARLRAVETRKDVVVNSNNGFCGLIEASGRISLEKRSKQSFVEPVIVTPNNKLTLYTEFPNLFIYMSVLIVVGFLCLNYKSK
ncbi:MAG TPA: apolipoprotein N-acyltransferase [Bacteroidales bacterium]